MSNPGWPLSPGTMSAHGPLATSNVLRFWAVRGIRFGGLWRHSEFVKLWAGQTISLFGSQVSQLAIPGLPAREIFLHLPTRFVRNPAAGFLRRTARP